MLFIENHDSFSWNVIDTLPVPRDAVHVVTAARAAPRLGEADAVVVGPGPMDPVRAGLVELVREAARRKLPLLGVCLGHQALGLAFGARLVRCTPAHGKQAHVTMEPSRSFPGLTGELAVMRYHSLALADVEAPLRVVGRLPDGLPMAIEHATLPLAGVQFHPDSFATPRGRALVEAWFTSIGLPRDGAPRAAAEVPASAARDVTPVTPLSLASLLQREAFALLGPGFGEGDAWTLLDLAAPDADATLWYAAAESRTPMSLRGRATRHALNFDVSPAELAPRLDERGFLEGVAAIREAIAAGDVYQVNLTLRAALGACSGAALLAALCRARVPRFAAWVRAPGVGELVSASPELLFAREGRRVRVEPMKGTAGAGQGATLLASEKDRAELAMITDLLRDDLQRICVPGSVRVVNARRLVELPYAVQTVADVEGTLPAEAGTAALLAQLHPGGSVTGAPREAACATIARLEATPRGAYCGALGLELGAQTRVALLIRTAERTADGWRYGVGSGITWDSDAHAELDEVRLKLGALGAPAGRP